MVHNTSTARHANRQPATMPSSFEDLLIYLDDSATARNALAYAEALNPDGNTCALMLGFMANYPMSFYGEVPGDAWLIVQEQAEAEAMKMEDRLRANLASAGSRAELRRANVMHGEEGNTIVTQGRYADITVIGWSAITDANRIRADLQKTLFEAALFHSGRPVLLVPEAFKRLGHPKRVLIAWTPERESVRAVNDAMAVLKSAEQVHIVVVNTGAMMPEANAGDDMARHLARHDIKVDVKHVPSNGEPVHKVLLNEVRYLGADLVVMGGYGHSRTGEWLFGGVTRDILNTADVPLLMSH
jgi:nucleotide-binding universal stress UspA family protein